jgi:hypothetical protein
VMLLADAAAASGQVPDAREIIAALEQVAVGSPSPMLLIHLAYARAVLADDDDSPAAYAELMGLDLTRWPWAQGRACLAYGRWLARQDAISTAMQALTAATQTFDRIGAAPWARQAAREIAALRAGGRPAEDSSAG